MFTVHVDNKPNSFHIILQYIHVATWKEGSKRSYCNGSVYVAVSHTVHSNTYLNTCTYNNNYNDLPSQGSKQRPVNGQCPAKMAILFVRTNSSTWL